MGNKETEEVLEKTVQDVADLDNAVRHLAVEMNDLMREAPPKNTKSCTRPFYSLNGTELTLIFLKMVFAMVPAVAAAFVIYVLVLLVSSTLVQWVS